MFVTVRCGKKQVELEIKKMKTIPVIDGKVDKVWDEIDWTDIGMPLLILRRKPTYRADLRFYVIRLIFISFLI